MSRSAACLAVLALSATPALAQQWMRGPVYWPELEAQGAEIVATGDVDGAHGPDLLVFEMDSWQGPYDRFRVHFADGAGGFAPGPDHPLPPQDVVPVGPALADVTGDGLLDVLVAHQASPFRFGVHPGLPDGTFGPLVSNLLPNVVHGVDVVDVDGDGVNEVALAHPTFDGSQVRVRFLAFNGGGFLVSDSAYLDGYEPGVHSLAGIDLEGDGVPDLAAGGRWEDEVHLLPTIAGAPSLGTVHTLDFPTTSSSGVQLSVGDMEADGDLDLLAMARNTPFHIDPSSFTSYVQVLENTGAGFVAGTATQEARFAWPRVLLEDWDGDGLLDAVGNSGNAIKVLRYLGGGELDEPVSIQSGQLEGAAGWFDVDLDGIEDLILSRGVLYRDGSLEPLLEDYPVGTSTPFADVHVRDHEDDGDLDFYSISGSIHLNPGTGDITGYGQVVDPFPTPPVDFAYQQPTAIDDFDGDGRADMVVTYWDHTEFFPTFVEMRLLVDDGVGGFALKGPAAAPGLGIFSVPTSSPAPTADVDGDGDRDILLEDVILLNDGCGFFTFTAPLFDAHPRDAGDVDGDGDVDLLARVGFSELVLLRQDGPLAFTPVELISSPSADPNQFPRLLDVDEDGDLDVFAGDDNLGRVWVLENDGTGTFATHELLGIEGCANRLAAFDVDGDGQLDLVAARETSASVGELSFVQVWRRLPGAALAYDNPRAFPCSRVQVLADIDEDGDIDAVGPKLTRGATFHGPGAGLVRQYGAGIPGTGGAVPVLGANGPMRAGYPDTAIRLRRGVGGAAAFLYIGTGEAALVDAPVAGMTTWVSPVLFALPFTCSGAPGEAGAGGFDFSVAPFAGILAGLTFFHQGVVADPGSPLGFTVTNGLEVRYGS